MYTLLIHLMTEIFEYVGIGYRVNNKIERKILSTTISKVTAIYYEPNKSSKSKAAAKTKATTAKSNSISKIQHQQQRESSKKTSNK